MPQKTESDWLVQQILSFMTVILSCRDETSFAIDRPLYAEDLVVAMRWIAQIQGGTDIGSVAEEIIDPQTDKRFGDYWRQGVWGERALEALAKLQGEIRARRAQ